MMVIWVNQNARAVSRHIKSDILPSTLFPAEESLPLRCCVCFNTNQKTNLHNNSATASKKVFLQLQGVLHTKGETYVGNLEINTRPLIIKVRNWVLLVTLLILTNFFCSCFTGGGIVQCQGPSWLLFLN